MKTFDYSRYLDMKWDNDIVNLISQIRMFQGRQEYYTLQYPEELKRLIIVAKAQSTASSNDIEGIRTTQTRLLQLCEEKVSPRNRDECEISGYKDVLNTIHESYSYIDIAPRYILQMHRDLFKRVGTNAGGFFKTVQNYICETDASGKRKILFTPLAPYETELAMHNLCEQFNMYIANQQIDSLILIPIFIHDFLCVHPFNDGNGRMSRLLTTLILYKADILVGKYISLENKIARTKDSYYSVLSESQEGWYDNTEDVTPFIKYLLGTVIEAYRDLEDRISIASEKLSSIDIVRKAVSTKLGKFSKKDILDMCFQLSSTSVENALKSMIQHGEIIRIGSGRAIKYAAITK